MHIILVHPRIPQNAGAVARLAAATNTKLTLVRPLGFRINQAAVRRAGLDYWELADVEVADHLKQAIQSSNNNTYYFSRHAQRSYAQVKYDAECTLVFGSEDEGLPPEVHAQVSPEHLLRIPIFNPKVRSLNLATSVAIALYEALRQIHSRSSISDGDIS